MYLLGVVTRTLFGNVEDLPVRVEFSHLERRLWCFVTFCPGV